MRRLGITQDELKQYPIEVGLQTDKGYPYRGTLDYVAPAIDRATGTLAVRAVLQNENGVLVPGNFVRVRVGAADEHDSLLVPDAALGSDQGGRYVLVVGKDDVVEQRKVTIGPRVGELRVIESGLRPDERVVVAGVLRAVPGQKVDPQLQTLAAVPSAAAGGK
jgi:RND family efflux transporter MFP subunit